MAKSSPITDASMKAPSPTSPALQTTERDTRAPAATCVRGPRLVGPTMTAFGPIVTPSPRMTGPTRRARRVDVRCRVRGELAVDREGAPAFEDRRVRRNPFDRPVVHRQVRLRVQDARTELRRMKGGHTLTLASQRRNQVFLDVLETRLRQRVERAARERVDAGRRHGSSAVRVAVRTARRVVHDGRERGAAGAMRGRAAATDRNRE